MYSRFIRGLFPFYLFLFSFFLVSQLGKHFFFHFSYLSGIRIDYLAPTLYFSDILSVPLIIATLVQLSGQLYRYKRWILEHKLFVIAVSLFFIINFIFSLSKPLWIYWFVRVIQLTLLFVFFNMNGRNKKMLSPLLWGLLAGSFCELALALLQLSYRHSLQGWWYYLGERSFSIFTPGIAKAYFLGVEFLRPYGTFSHPNSLAGFYLLIYAFMLTQKKITNTILKSTLLIISSLLVVISFSRTAIATYALVNLLYFSKNIETCKACFMAKLSIAGVLILFVLSISGDLNGIQKRTDFFEKSLSIISQRPFSGTGIGSYLIAQHKYPQKFSTFFEQPVHNIFLLALAQLGIPFFLLLFFAMYRYIAKHLIKLYFALPLLCIVVTGSVDHYWITLQQNLLVFAVIFGILFSYEEKAS